MLLIENLAKRIKVKTIATLIVMSVFAVMILTSREIPDAAMQIITMVVSFYFGTQTKKNTNMLEKQ